MFVTIRTNSASTSLTVNDTTTGSIRHYGVAGALNIIKCHTASYHENGKVAFAEIATGRIVLESKSEVEHIHLTATNGNFVDITVAKATDVEMPDFSRDPVDLSSGSKVVVALQDGTAQETDKDYVWLTAVGIYEQVTVSDSATEAGTTYASQAGTNEQKEAAQQIANNITFNDGGVDYKVTATKVGENWTYEVKTKSGEATESYTASVTGTTVNVQTTGETPSPVATKTDNGVTEETKQEIKNETVQHGIEDEMADTSVKVTINEVPMLMSLAQFRDNINNDVEGYKTAKVELMSNINLKGVVWTPIKEFSGVFDGKGYKISNFVVNTPNDQTGGALFAKLSGEVNNSFNQLSDVYTIDAHTLNEDAIAESKYTCVVKNLVISQATTNAENNKDCRFSAALVGQCINAYISNIEVQKSTINVFKYGAGIAGIIQGTVIRDSHIADDSVIQSIAGDAGHVAGFVGQGVDTGARYNACINLTNDAPISGNYGNIGGITAMGKKTLHYNCVNNGRIFINGSAATECGGINGNGDKSWFLKCTNNGNIDAVDAGCGSTLEKAGIGGIGGISGYHQNWESSVYYQCYNFGNITNTGDPTKTIARICGIACDDATSNVWEEVANYGIITAGPTNYGVYDISNNVAMRLEISEAENFAAIANLIESSDYAYIYVTAQVADNGILHLPANLKSITITSAIVTKLDLINVNSNYITINVPGTYELVNIGNKNINLVGNGSNVTIGSSETEGSSITMNSTSGSLTNNGILSRVNFGGTGTYTFINNGTVSTTKTANSPTSHTISTISACTITIHNYGTIESLKEGSLPNSDYAILFYNGCTVNFYAHNGSTVRTNGNCLGAFSNAQSVTFYYQSGCVFDNNGSELHYPPFYGGNVYKLLID